MNRREFLKQTSAAVLALSAATYVPATFAAEKIRRVGLIGAGRYSGYGACRPLIQENAS